MLYQSGAPEYRVDPDRLRGFSPLSAVSLETYQAPQAVGADERSRQFLGGKVLQPNSNPAGYLTSPPLLLTKLASIGKLPLLPEQANAPISAIRVRVAGVTGLDPASRDKVRLAATTSPLPPASTSTSPLVRHPRRRPSCSPPATVGGRS